MAKFRTDFIYDSNNDLIIRNGKFLTGVAENQYINQIIQSAPGNWRYHPTVGVNLKKYLGAPLNFAVVENAIISQLKRAGYSDIRINANDQNAAVNLILSDTLTLNVTAFRD